MKLIEDLINKFNKYNLIILIEALNLLEFKIYFKYILMLVINLWFMVI